MRRVAVALALVLAAGGLLSVTNGLASVLGAVAGYADFGYLPSKCGRSSRTTQTLDGGTIRVCQTEDNITYGFFAGHETWPLANAWARMTLSLPDLGRAYSCCGSGATYPSFASASLDPVSVGNPIVGVSRSSAGASATITKTVRMTPGASSYTVTYAITNVSGGLLRARPLVTVDHYGYAVPGLGTAGPPRAISMVDPLSGGSVTFSESSVDGAEAAASFTEGSSDRLDNFTTPAAPALDNTLHPEDNTPYAQAALAWPITTMAAGTTRKVSITVNLAQTRDVRVSLHGSATAESPVTLDANVTDERGVAGGLLRWGIRNNGFAGTSVLDSTGHGTIELPAARGERRVYVYYDANRNNLYDSSEPYVNGEVWAPSSPAQPPTPPGATPTTPRPVVTTQQPSAPPVKAAGVKVPASLAYAYKLTKTRTRLTSLVVKGVPAGSTVTATCSKGCAKKSVSKRNASGKVSLKALTGRALKAGTVIKVTISRPGMVPVTKTLTIRAHRAPKLTST